MHFRLEFPSKSEHYIDDVAVAARMDILECGNTSVDPVIYAHPIAGAVHCNVAAGGIAPYDAAVSPSVKVVVECVDTAAHNTLRMGTTALTEGNGVRDAGWAVTKRAFLMGNALVVGVVERLANSLLNTHSS